MSGGPTAESNRQRPALFVAHTLSDTPSLNTNNPFRRVSPSLQPSEVPRFPLRSPNLSEMSRNPFLDSMTSPTMTPSIAPDAAAAKLADDIFAQPRQQSPIKQSSISFSRTPGLSPVKGVPITSPQSANPSPARRSPLESAAGPLAVSSRHRPSQSGESRPLPSGESRPLPQQRRPSRPLPGQISSKLTSPIKPILRRNSESSIKTPQEEKDVDKTKKEKDVKSKPAKRSKFVDLIDQLDGTGLLGHIHHGGPFDACNTYRNQKQNAPMKAFAADSANNSLGGKMPIRKAGGYVDVNGLELKESHEDYNVAPKLNPREERETEPSTMGEKPNYFGYINYTERSNSIYGVESTGLGTSTFLEGAPASASAQTAQEQYEEVGNLPPSGLVRKNTLVNRIRALSAPKQPEDLYEQRSASLGSSYPPRPNVFVAQSAGGQARLGMDPAKDPFLDNAGECANESLINTRDADVDRIDRSGSVGIVRPPALTRSMTADSAQRQGSVPAVPSMPQYNSRGFIGRMKSFRSGNRRPVVGLQEDA